MCYSALVKKDLKFLSDTFGATVVRNQLASFEHLSEANPKAYPPIRSRIFPGHFAPVLFEENGTRLIKVMRYGVYPPPTVLHPEKYTTYNARRDNLQSRFWSDAFMKHHGFIALRGMYEWVLVQDLLEAGVVPLDRILEYFSKQTEARKAKILAQGKTYKPTATELADPRARRIIIEFKPQGDGLLLVPIIFSAYASPNGVDGLGFAIVTDDPPKEIERAGHDRCPIILKDAALKDWLDPVHRSIPNILECLKQKNDVQFTHDLEPTGS